MLIRAHCAYTLEPPRNDLRLAFFLEHADEHPHIGIKDAAIRQLVYASHNQTEIEMFIGADLDATNCLP